MAAVGLGGCMKIVENKPSPYSVTIMPEKAFPVANVAYVRSLCTRCEDPDAWHERWSPVNIQEIHALKSNDDKFFLPSTVVSGIYPVVLDQRANNILFSRGYNPIMYDSCWPYYKQIADENSRFELTVKGFSAEKAYNHRNNIHWDESQHVYINFEPLPKTEADIAAGMQVDHGLLLYLLNEPNFFAQLKKFHKNEMNVPSVQIVAVAILEMMEAHDLLWPDYKWSEKEQENRKWCECLRDESAKYTKISGKNCCH